MRTTSRAFAILFITAMGLSPRAQAAAVINGDFETGDFTGWVQGGDTAYSSVVASSDLPVHGGDFAAAFGPSDFGTLSQTIDVSAGTAYRLSFWLMNLSDGSPIDFAVAFGADGTSLPPDPPATPYQLLTVDTRAPADTLALTFSFRNMPAFWLLDDVEVHALPTPLPAAILLAAPALAVLVTPRRRAPA
ncbi:MAG: hypothetical protein HY749_06575 [Gammaproteobacteria bacterium]|nr:hypothetical protein [Gammaproteobacteria bacterium]MBI5619315.1 hypothetical protein [Gammaproteobacteria bacterium]